MTSPTLDPNAGYSDIIKYYLSQWGLTDLSTLVDQLGRTGASSDEISLRLQDTDQWKKRFAGNELRRQQGLAPLDPATYVGLEAQYDQIMSPLPPGFYDSEDARAQLIGHNVSPSELSAKVQDVTNGYFNADQSVRDAFHSYYPGSGPADAIAMTLDPKMGEAAFNQRLTAAGIGGAALQQGLNLTSQATATRAAQVGVTLGQAQAAYRDIAARVSTDQSLSGRFGGQQSMAGGTPGSFGQAQEEEATLLNSGAAQRQQQTLYSEEQGQFGGHGGAERNGASNNPGSNY